jgi:hypothetical protein
MFRDETEALLEAWGSWGSSPRAVSPLLDGYLQLYFGYYER